MTTLRRRNGGTLLTGRDDAENLAGFLERKITEGGARPWGRQQAN